MRPKRDRVAIVTGGGRGIGRAISVRLASEGANVVIAQRTEQGLDVTLETIDAADGIALFVATDVSIPHQVSNLIETTVGEFGRIDILVNNAAVPGAYTAFLDLSLDSWSEMIDVNLTGVFLTAQAAARIMVEQGEGGRIINIASIDGFVAEPYAAHYNAAKGGVIMLTRSMAVDLAPHGILVNAVAPGPILTEKERDPFSQEQWSAAWDRIPLGRPGQAAEVAAAVAFLASDEASFIHGHVLTVDGGYLAG
jgi:NAD(P)-dependent dehydrogenase (short-subunit alcohol dehydrogenase family)